MLWATRVLRFSSWLGLFERSGEDDHTEMYAGDCFCGDCLVMYNFLQTAAVSAAYKSDASVYHLLEFVLHAFMLQGQLESLRLSLKQRKNNTDALIASGNSARDVIIIFPSNSRREPRPAL